MAWAGDAFLCDSDRRPWGRGSNPIITAFGFDPRPGISLPSHMAGRSPIMTTRKRREKLDLGSSKLDQIFRTARRIYQSPVSPCTNQMRHATKCLVCRVTGHESDNLVNQEFGHNYRTADNSFPTLGFKFFSVLCYVCQTAGGCEKLWLFHRDRRYFNTRVGNEPGHLHRRSSGFGFRHEFAVHLVHRLKLPDVGKIDRHRNHVL